MVVCNASRIIGGRDLPLLAEIYMARLVTKGFKVLKHPPHLDNKKKKTFVFPYFSHKMH